MFLKLTHNRFFNHFMDLLIVIIGVTVAFQVEKWDNHRREVALHETLVNDLVSEIDLNIAELERVSELQQNTLATYKKLREIFQKDDLSNSVDDIVKLVGSLNYIDLPTIQTGQLNNYLSSTNYLNYKYKPELISLNNELSQFNVLEQALLKQRTENMYEILGDGIDLYRKKVVNPDLFISLELRNFIFALNNLENEFTASQKALLVQYRKIKVSFMEETK